ncbi:accessory Sec system protein Asp2 [Pediococcus stilesii]|uniref:Accessory Sec system protein Asp2 n=1 Tax=Pediococcus stilesii TaxID=331679 RepID=A0A5R9BWE9_9LACO|nr:accessory Sec system protein Asp2 [Pediococcus stilesii]TLQ04825.1 accessory Sec system protein Asp2 [Pediococcus stilesii]
MAKTEIIHLGTAIPNFKEDIGNDFIYRVADNNEEEILVNKQAVISGGQLNSKYRGSIFLVTGQNFLEKSQVSTLRALPANSIIIDDKLVISADVERALELKNPQFIDFKNTQDLAKQIKKYFFAGQLGYKLNFDKVRFNPSFMGTITQLGHNSFKVESKNNNQYEKVMSWHAPLGIAPNTEWDVILEHERLTLTTNLKLRLSLVNPQNERRYLLKDIKNDELNQDIKIDVAPQGGYLVAEIFVKGSDISFEIGQIHVRHSRGHRGEMLIGEHEIIDESQLNSSVLYYFDSGDFKPPLNVYFSGFRTAEGVEGGIMMRNLKSPSLIFGDQRILGGSFYVGSSKIQKGIIEVIKQTMEKLNFEPNDLIFSGLSMGTYAALYYSSFLSPAWVIIGKPLVNLGTIAGNERINRPNGFPTSLDVLLRLTGDVNHENLMKANNIFWDVFSKNGHKGTNFVIAYMENDDYDQYAFDQLTEYLHESVPESRIIHKGLVGRHNDATGELIQWYLQQYRNILETEYGKKFED